MKPNLFIPILLLLLGVTSGYAQISRSGTQFTTYTLAGSSANWSAAGNVVSSNDGYSTFGNLPATEGVYTDYLVATGFNFSFSFGTVITGIEVDVERSDPNNLTSDHSVRMVKEGVIGGSDKSSGAAFPATDTYTGYGGYGELWGDSWNYKDINDPLFGIAIAVKRNNAAGVTAGRIDHIRIRIHYSLQITLPVKLIAFNAVKHNNTVSVKWITEEENSIDGYVIERSLNGRDFAGIGTVGSRNNSGQEVYHFSDNNPVKGNSWYRLKMIEISGQHKNSSIVPIKIDDTGANLIYPNLIFQGQDLYISNQGVEPLTVQFFNNAGQTVSSTKSFAGKIPGNVIANYSGNLYYRIINSKGVLTGSGKIVIQ